MACISIILIRAYLSKIKSEVSKLSGFVFLLKMRIRKNKIQETSNADIGSCVRWSKFAGKSFDMVD